MDDYLKGFVDGYNKAKGTPVEATVDSKELAKLSWKAVTDLQEKENSRRKNFA